jgi:hypothetical protein
MNARAAARTVVDPVSGDDADGVVDVPTRPFATISSALAAVRLARRATVAAAVVVDGGIGDDGIVGVVTSANKTVELTPGIHYLNATMVLGAADSNTHFVSAAGGTAWISGGRVVTTDEWRPVAGKSGLWEATLDQSRWGDDVEVTGLFTTEPHTRLTLARYPNGNVETTPWGYASPTRVNVSINASAVLEWHKPPKGEPPVFEFIDLSDPNNPTGFVKNDSTMSNYNAWTTGKGGVCDSVWNPGVPSYWW